VIRLNWLPKVAGSFSKSQSLIVYEAKDSTLKADYSTFVEFLDQILTK